jgi:hypothetical protein
LENTIKKIIIDNVEVENVPEDFKLKDLMKTIETAKNALSGFSYREHMTWYPLEMLSEKEKEILLKECGCHIDPDGKGVWCPPLSCETGGTIKIGRKKYRFDVSLTYKTGKYHIKLDQER